MDTNIIIGAAAVLAVLVYVFFLRSSPAPKKAYVPEKKPVYVPGTKYSKEEVAKHNTAEDLWLIIDGRVYDVTTYLGKHPGMDALMNDAGGDASVGFHGTQHPEDAVAIRDEYLIGDLMN